MSGLSPWLIRNVAERCISLSAFSRKLAFPRTWDSVNSCKMAFYAKAEKRWRTAIVAHFAGLFGEVIGLIFQSIQNSCQKIEPSQKKASQFCIIAVKSRVSLEALLGSNKSHSTLLHFILAEIFSRGRWLALESDQRSQEHLSHP